MTQSSVRSRNLLTDDTRLGSGRSSTRLAVRTIGVRGHLWHVLSSRWSSLLSTRASLSMILSSCRTRCLHRSHSHHQSRSGGVGSLWRRSRTRTRDDALTLGGRWSLHTLSRWRSMNLHSLSSRRPLLALSCWRSLLTLSSQRSLLHRSLTEFMALGSWWTAGNAYRATL